MSLITLGLTSFGSIAAASIYTAAVSTESKIENTRAEEITKTAAIQNNIRRRANTMNASELYSLQQHQMYQQKLASGWTCPVCGSMGNIGSRCTKCNCLPSSSYSGTVSSAS